MITFKYVSIVTLSDHVQLYLLNVREINNKLELLCDISNDSLLMNNIFIFSAIQKHVCFHVHKSMRLIQ